MCKISKPKVWNLLCFLGPVPQWTSLILLTYEFFHNDFHCEPCQTHALRQFKTLLPGAHLSLRWGKPFFCFITFLDTFVLSFLLIKIRKWHACLSVFLLFSLLHHKYQSSPSLSRKIIFPQHLFWHTLKCMLLYFCHGFYLSFGVHFLDWGSIQKKCKISRDHHEWTYEIM